MRVEGILLRQTALGVGHQRTTICQIVKSLVNIERQILIETHRDLADTQQHLTGEIGLMTNLSGGTHVLVGVCRKTVDSYLCFIKSNTLYT